jgi:PHD/YefM family antitoxin component YafN of YafNO toxin-antitoxin module
MATIKPSSDLRNKYKEISEPCKVTQEPFCITANGKEDTATIESHVLDELYQTIDLMQKINEGIADVNAGRTVSLEEAKKRLL